MNTPAARLSPLAMLSLACVLFSMGACVIASVLALVVSPMAGLAVVGLPLVALLGVALAVLALRQIGRSQGMFVGRAIAIASLFLGLITAILQGAAVASATAQAFAVKQNLVPVVDAFMLAGSRQDRAAQRASMGESAGNDISDARLDEFISGLEARLGAARGADFGLGVMMRAMTRVREAAATAPNSPGQVVTENPKPVELLFARGNAIAFVTPDDEAMRATQRILIADVLVLLPDGAAAALREAGPAASLAARLGLKTARP